MKFSEDDAFTISFPDTQTMKISCSERSFRWALAHILKDHGNVTFLFSRNAFADYPKSPDLKVPVKTFHDAPSFNILRTGFGSKSWKNYFCTRKKFKGWDCHTVSKLSFPWKDYKLGLWPEEVLPLIGGKRIAPSKSNYSYWNPCYSSKSSRKVAIKNILKILDADPDRMISNDFRGQPPLNSCQRQ